MKLSERAAFFDFINLQMYYSILKQLAKHFKRRLSQELSSKDQLTVMDSIIIFCNSFEKDDAFRLFKALEVESDKMYLSLSLNAYERKVYMERDVKFENVDEEFQLQFELNLNLLEGDNQFYQYWEVWRDHMGDFYIKEKGDSYSYDKKYIYFSDYLDGVLSSSEMTPFVNIYPASVSIHLNADH